MESADPSRLPGGFGDPGDLVARLPAVVWEADARQDRMTFVSPRAHDLLGHDPDTWRDTPAFWEDHVHPDDRGRVTGAVAEAIADGETSLRVRYRFRDSAGTYRWFQDSISIVTRHDGGVHLAGLMLDLAGEQDELDAIAAGGRMDDAAGLSGPLHEAIVDNLQDGVYYVDTDRRITYWNKGAERLTGYRASDVVGRRCFDNILAHVDANGVNLCMRGCPLLDTMRDGATRDVQVWLRHADGSRRPIQTRTAPIRGTDGAIVGGVEIFNDATGLIEAQDAAEAARHDALTDQLTGLPNRRLLDAVLDARKEELDRSGRAFAFLIADVDRFKLFNDRYGHAVGDEALKVVAQTLRGAVRGADTLVRWGGEEFAIVTAIGDEARMHQLADRLLALMRAARVHAAVGPLAVRISIGGAIATRGEPLEQVFARADHALLRAKAMGRDRFVLDGAWGAGADPRVVDAGVVDTVGVVDPGVEIDARLATPVMAGTPATVPGREGATS
jgi:diguanylate cyclase (GGDEF)-like protein/PAS domain S-box-containing protein